MLWAAYTVSFVVLYALPGDPVSLMYGSESSDVTPEQLDALRAQYGLDQPLPVQYVTRLGAVAARRPRHVGGPAPAGDRR